MPAPVPAPDDPHSPPRVDFATQVVALLARVARLEQENHTLRQQAAVPRSPPRLPTTRAPIILFAFDREGAITVFEGEGLLITGRTQREVLGRSFFAVYADVPEVVAAAHRALAGQECITEVRLGRGDFEMYYTPVYDPAGGISGVSGLAIDVSAHLQAVQALTHKTLHDPLTSLPNRVLLLDRLEMAVALARRGQTALTLLLLDLDRFKDINDTFGHHYGDVLLQQVGSRLRHTLRESDTVARLGGDEFAVLLPGAHLAEATQTAHTIGAAFQAPFTVYNHTIEMGVSIGIACYPADSHDGLTLLRHADVAMYLAKQGQRGPVVYASAQDQHSPHRLALVSQLREAIAAGGLLLHYQPVVELASHRVTSVEALVRWQHPTQGLLSPLQFIPLAESTGLMTRLTQWVLEAALRQRQRWHEAGIELDMAVNLSMSGLHGSDVVETTTALLQRCGVPASALWLEITESTLMRDTSRTLEVLTRLAKLGVHLAVDDFGTGYSSLASLKQLPVEALKIDRSFVQEMMNNATDRAIVTSTIGLGHRLGLRVVAEGVETVAIWNHLRAKACDAAQGYYLSRPLPGAELAAWLQTTAWQQS